MATGPSRSRGAVTRSRYGSERPPEALGIVAATARVVSSLMVRWFEEAKRVLSADGNRFTFRDCLDTQCAIVATPAFDWGKQVADPLLALLQVPDAAIAEGAYARFAMKQLHALNMCKESSFWIELEQANPGTLDGFLHSVIAVVFQPTGPFSPTWNALVTETVKPTVSAIERRVTQHLMGCLTEYVNSTAVWKVCTRDASMRLRTPRPAEPARPTQDATVASAPSPGPTDPTGDETASSSRSESQSSSAVSHDDEHDEHSEDGEDDEDDEHDETVAPVAPAEESAGIVARADTLSAPLSMAYSDFSGAREAAHALTLLQQQAGRK